MPTSVSELSIELDAKEASQAAEDAVEALEAFEDAMNRLDEADITIRVGDETD